MHLLLLYNPVAGGGQRRPEVFQKLLISAGYRCDLYATDDPAWRGKASRDTVVVIAGGDGTVKEVAHQLVGTGLPLAILPIGTSNNIALELGIFGSPSSLFRRWHDWHPQPFDVLQVTTPRETRYCFEGCGFGLFGRWMHLGQFMPDRIPSETRKQVVRQDRRFLSGVVESSTADECTIEFNDQQSTQQALLVIAANIGLMGARVPVAPAADPRDGLLDVLIATEADRVPLIHWLRAVADGQAVAPPPLEVHRAPSLRLEFARGGYHFDDEAGLWGCEGAGGECTPMAIEAVVKPGALQILAP
jgi:diacylglycerol kinase family enzyme